MRRRGREPRSAYGLSHLRQKRNRQLSQPVDPRDAFVHRLSLEPQIAKALREERKPLLQLHPGEVRAEAVVHARAKRQRPRAPAVGRNVEAVGVGQCRAPSTRASPAPAAAPPPSSPAAPPPRSRLPVNAHTIT